VALMVVLANARMYGTGAVIIPMATCPMGGSKWSFPSAHVVGPAEAVLALQAL
jgi:hypothetical protein